MRREGARIPWSNPKQFRKYLAPMAEGIDLADGASMTAEELEKGIILHLGSHVAALMEDRPPLGVLSADDIVAHQLEGAPTLISVARLLESSGKTRFDLLRPKIAEAKADLLIGGDVMLGRSIGEQIKAGQDPFAGIRALLGGASVSVMNLECVVSEEGTPVAGKRYHLRAPAQAAAAIAAAGWDAVGIAHNHANDFGGDAPRDSVARLQSAGLTVIGGVAGAQVMRTSDERASKRIALIAFDAIGTEDETSALASERPRLAQELKRAKKDSDFVVVLVHWDEESSPAVREEQREARALANQSRRRPDCRLPSALHPAARFLSRTVRSFTR